MPTVCYIHLTERFWFCKCLSTNMKRPNYQLFDRPIHHPSSSSFFINAARMYWDKPHLKYCCPGMSNITKVQYATGQTATQKGKRHLQFK